MEKKRTAEKLKALGPLKLTVTLTHRLFEIALWGHPSGQLLGHILPIPRD